MIEPDPTGRADRMKQRRRRAYAAFAPLTALEREAVLAEARAWQKHERDQAAEIARLEREREDEAAAVERRRFEELYAGIFTAEGTSSGK